MNNLGKRQTLSSRLGVFLLALVMYLTAFGGINLFAGTAKAVAASIIEANGYTSDYSDRADLREAGLDANRLAMEEGAVLLQIGSNYAPLDDDAKVTVLGKNSVNPVYSGTGSSGGTASPINFYQGLEYDGYGTHFEVNPVARAHYSNNAVSGTGRPAHSGMSGNFSGFPVGEMRATGPVNYGGTAWNGTSTAPAADVAYDPAVTTPGYSNYEAIRHSYSEYNDAAILVFSRFGGEGYDMPRSAKMIDCTSSTYPAGTGTGSFNVAAGSWGTNNANLKNIIPGAHSMDSHYMAIDLNEENAMKEASKYFDNVFVFINSASQIELGLLAKYPKVTAIWIGTPGENGFEAMPGLMSGKVNPSGGLVDTYSRNFNNDPAMLNFSQNGVDYGHFYYVGTERQAIPFVEYQESIYLGYRYYETRYAEIKKATDAATANEWYNDNVVYPFGYGLSFGNFSKTVTEVRLDGTPVTSATIPSLTATSKFEIDVDVTNAVGAKAGKEIVQIYAEAPYTSGGIEKAAKVLVGYGKTDIIQPGQTKTVTITVDAYAMASYDWSDANNNSHKGYEIEAGLYNFYVARDVHDSSLPISFTLTNGLKITNDPVTGNKVENIYDEMSNHMKENSVMLSRADNFANLNTLSNGSTRRSVTKEFMDKFSTTSYSTYSPANIQSLFEQTNLNLTGKVIQNNNYYYTKYPYTQAKLAAGAMIPAAGGNNISPEVQLTYEETTLKFFDMYGVDYNDAKWDTFLNQLTYQQLFSVMNGNYYSIGMDNVGKPFIPDLDGPVGFTGGSTGNGQSERCLKIVSTCVIAATYNVEIAMAIGEIVGNEGIWGYDSNTGGTAPAAQGAANAGATTGATSGTKIGGWYAPASNTHRTPFSGRNFEYFSEDGHLAGTIMGSLVVGAQKFGVYSFIKHFFLNDQETDRGTSGGLATWVDEQAAREIYGKTYEIAVKMSNAYAASAGRQSLMAVMSAFNRIGHRGAFMDSSTQQVLLRTEWGFKGQVITDYGAGVQAKNLIAGNDKFLSNVTWNQTIVDTLNDKTPIDFTRYNLTEAQLAAITDSAANVPTYGNAYKWAVRTAAKNILYTGANSAGAMSSLLPIVQNVNLTTANNNITGAAKVFSVGVFENYDLLRDTALTHRPRVNYGERDKVTYKYELNDPADTTLSELGLTLTESGRIYGIPTANTANTVNVVVKITATGKKGADTINYLPIRQQITFRVGAAASNATISFTDSYLGVAEFGKAFSKSVPAATITGGTGSVTYRLSTGAALPAGLSLNTNGTISGTVTSTEPYVAVVRITASATVSGTALTAEAVFVISVGTTIGTNGADGLTPYIKDGNWWIGTTDTGIVAEGNDGDKGDKGDKGDTGATGAAGTNGTNGTNGIDGKDGKDGKDGADAVGGCNSTAGLGEVGGLIAILILAALVAILVFKRREKQQ